MQNKGKLHKRLKAERETNSQLLNKIKSLNNKISKIKFSKKKESFEEKQHKKIMLQKEENKLPAVMLFDQITNFGKKKITANSTTLKLYILWQKRSPSGYEFARDMKLFALPHHNTLKKYLGYSTGETGITSLIQSRLHHEFRNLEHTKEKMGSLIIDEMAIQTKLIYDRKLDLYLGNANADIEELGIGDRLANHLLSFLFKGLSSNYRIPVAYFFTNQLTGNELYKLSKHVIESVKKVGFNVLRISTNNSNLFLNIYFEMLSTHVFN